MCKYLIYEKNRLKVYRDERYSNDLICSCDTLGEAQELILSLTEENAYRCYYEQCQYVNPEDAIWLMQHAPKYGWDKYSIKRVGEC